MTERLVSAPNPKETTIMARRLRIVAGLAVTLAAGVTSVAPVGATPSPVNLAGGGATFQANIQDVCRSLYNSSAAANPSRDVVTYAGTVGSGTGKTNFRTGTYDFGGTDSIYGATETKPSSFVYVPLIGGPIGIGYRIDGIAPAGAQINLTGELVAKIFAGQITNWNDPAIAAVNKATAVALNASVAANGVTVKSTVRGTNVTFTATMNAAALKRFKGKKITVTPVTDGTAGTPVMNAGVRKTVTKLAILAENTSYEVKAGTRVIGTLVPKAYTQGVNVTFPSLPIKVAYRSGNSGTTTNFANYLNKEFPTIWTKATSDAFTTAFPGTLPTDGPFPAESGNDGESTYVPDNNGAITYAELSFLT
ncbi:MAG: substrate-binding domain-containing protein, partial [Actinomycetota bacterium]